MTKTNTITRAQALAIAIERCADAPEVAEVLAKMYASITKPRAKTVSKARLANERLAKQVADAIRGRGPVTTKDLANLGIPEVMTTQKAAAVARVAVELGLITRTTEGKAVFYTA